MQNQRKKFLQGFLSDVQALFDLTFSIEPVLEKTDSYSQKVESCSEVTSGGTSTNPEVSADEDLISFDDSEEGDEEEEQQEMSLPGKKNHQNACPLDIMGEKSIWDSLNLGENLDPSERDLTLDLLIQHPEVFPSS